MTDSTSRDSNVEEIVVSLTRSERIWAVSNRVNLISLIGYLSYVPISFIVHWAGFDAGQIMDHLSPIFVLFVLIWFVSAGISAIAGATYVLSGPTGHDPRNGSKWYVAAMLIGCAPIMIYYYRKRV